MDKEIESLSEILGRHGLGLATSLNPEQTSQKESNQVSKRFEFVPIPRSKADDDPATFTYESIQQLPEILRQDWFEVLDALPPLSSEQMLALAQQFERGKECLKRINSEELSPELEAVFGDEVLQGQQAFDQMVRFNLRLVRSMAIKYRGYLPDVFIEDVFQSGCVGLLIAVEKWDWKRGYSFSTYATNWIRQAITRDAHNASGIARVPVHRYEGLLWDFKRNVWVDSNYEKVSIARDHDLWPLLEPLSVEEIREAPELDGILISKDDFLEVENDLFLLKTIEKIFSYLDERSQIVLTSRFGIKSGEDATLEEIGRSLKVTRERIRQIETDSIFKARVGIVLEVCWSSEFTQFREEKLSADEIQFLSSMGRFPTERAFKRFLKKLGDSAPRFEESIQKALREYARSNCLLEGAS